MSSAEGGCNIWVGGGEYFWQNLGPITVSIIAAVCIISIAFIIYAMWRYNAKSNFASPEAVQIAEISRRLFEDKKNDVTYSDFKNRIPNSNDDVTVYTAVRKLWREGELTPDNVQSVALV